MIVLALLLFTLLTIIAAIHLYWAFGGHWPGHDEASLTQNVIGTKDLTAMPPVWLTILVAMLIFLAGLLPLSWISFIAAPISPLLVQVGMVVLTGIFLIRGAITYTPLATKIEFEEPFATLNKKYYSPLCLAIGLGFAYLLLSV